MSFNLFKIFNSTPKENINLILDARERYLKVLNALKGNLNVSGNDSQAIFVKKLTKILHEDISQFIKLINGVDMWGGAGAVWEVYIQDQNLAKEFGQNMIELINLMQSTNIINGKIQSLKEFFQNN
jgi:hypothetical protein